MYDQHVMVALLKPQLALVATCLLLQETLNSADMQVQLADMHDAQDCQTHFNQNEYFRRLPTQTTLGATVLATSYIPSTQTLLQSNMSLVPNNTVCIAYKQTGGKGNSNLSNLGRIT